MILSLSYSVGTKEANCIVNDRTCELKGIVILQNDNFILKTENPGNIRNLKITESNLTYFPFDAIKKAIPKIEEIEATKCKLPQVNLLTESEFMNGLKKLDFSRNQIAELRPEDFKNFPDILEIDLSQNKISEIHRDTFVSNGKLEKLNIAKNSLKTLPKNLFATHKQLKNLQFQNNEIDLLPNLLSSNSEKIKITIDLSNNKINSISAEFYENLKDGSQINLKGNLCVDMEVTKQADDENSLKICFLKYMFKVSREELAQRAKMVKKQIKDIETLQSNLGITKGEFEVLKM